MANAPNFLKIDHYSRFGWQRIAAIGLIVIFNLVLNSCSSKDPKLVPSKVELPDEYPRSVKQSRLIEESQLKETTGEMELRLIQWWRQFESTELNQLIDRAMAHNQNVQISAYRVLQANSRYKQTKAEELPLVTLPASYSIETPEGGLGSLDKHGDRETGREYELGLSAQWQVDLWGERAFSIESLKAQLDRAHFLYDEEQRALIGAVVGAYIEYLSLNDRLRVAREREKELTAMLNAMKDKLRQGDTTAVEVNLQEALVMRVRASLPSMAIRQEEVSNQIAGWLGTIPGNLSLSSKGLQSLHFEHNIPSLPPRLILNRPDIMAAEYQLISAHANIDVARARLLPSLDLTAKAGYGTKHLSELLQPHSLLANFVANLTTTVFDGGRKEEEIAFSISAREELVEAYVRTIYQALREVDDAMVKFDLAGNRLTLQRNALNASREAKTLSERSYTLGAIDYLNMLDVTRTYLRDLDDYYKIQMEHLQGLSSLYTSLGGGVTQRTRVLSSPVLRVQNDLSTQHQVKGWAMDPTTLIHEGNWQVVLSGVHNKPGVASVWRDFENRLPDLSTDNRMIALSNFADIDSTGNDRRLFKLYIDPFASQAQANAWCRKLKQDQQRCAVVRLAELDNLAMLELIALDDWTEASTSTNDMDMEIEALEVRPTPVKPLASGKNDNYSKTKPSKKSTAAHKPKVNSNLANQSVRRSKWSIVVGSYIDQQPAKDLKTTLDSNGYPSSITSIMVDGELWRRVIVSGKESSQETEALLSIIQEKFGQGGAWILTN